MAAIPTAARITGSWFVQPYADVAFASSGL
jgi:hypothetical protein